MTDDGVTTSESEKPANNTPDQFERSLFVLSLVAIFVALWLWFVVFSARFKVIYDQLGMTELPYLTEVTLGFGIHRSYLLPLVALGLIVFGYSVIRRGDRKNMNRITAINWIIVALMPGYIYFSTHLPLIELQRKLGGG